MAGFCISVNVNAQRKLFLQANVSQISAFGHLAKLSRKKHGYRPSHHLSAFRKNLPISNPL